MGGISDTGIARETSLLGTLEHISRLVVSHTGNPLETLTHIARAIQQQLRSDGLTAAQLTALVVGDATTIPASSTFPKRLRVVQVTMRTVEDVANNCWLNQLQLLRITPKGACRRSRCNSSTRRFTTRPRSGGPWPT